ncbi:hypothetical protein [Roseateles amylovorans]|uniref:Uncharacterized protein n=1 Tax=Roseateles amylovorans TaxID=2978473 RepID=A0ABY6B2K2_9BURK|nr:hypothetical protein [Roseateles amylovorans]UXH79623.1 hypothetical protein N4261_06825 [Roseateles amylovorans]
MTRKDLASSQSGPKIDDESTQGRCRRLCDTRAAATTTESRAGILPKLLRDFSPISA